MGEDGGEAELSVAEGVLLGHALVARVAESLDVRAFFIKGPASVAQGLRRPKTSGDVDVFVAPGDLEAVLQGLRERGWRERPTDPDGRTFPKHSVTVDHPEWPCCIDVHYRFPGMEDPAGRCFEVMWAQTGLMDLDVHRIRVPSRALGILLLALHALRSAHLPECREELEYLSSVLVNEGLALAVMELATATGSLAAARPFLERYLPGAAAPEWPALSSEWRNRVLAREPGSARIIALAQASWRERPALLWRAVFPTHEVLLSRDIHADMSLRGRLVQHGARWARFLRAVPRIARDLKGAGKYGRDI